MIKNIEQFLLPANGSLDLTVIKTLNQHKEIYLSVLIGLAEVERLPYDKNHIVFKILVGRFYNTGYRLNNLSEIFNVSEKTIRKWGKALELGDAEEMNRVFAGNANKVKFTSEVLGYARGLYYLFKGKVKNYRQLAVEAIEDKYNISVSGERLRQLFLAETEPNILTEAELNTLAETELNTLAETEPNILTETELNILTETEPNILAETELNILSETKPNILAETEPNILAETELNIPTETEPKNIEVIQQAKEFNKPPVIQEMVSSNDCKRDDKGKGCCVDSPVLGKDPILPSNYFPFLGLPLSGNVNFSKPILLQHCGLILFSPWIDLVFPKNNSMTNLNKQWLSLFLLGGVNIEQSKHISFESLKKLVGPVIKDKRTQRSLLKEHASLDSVLDLCDRNGRLINATLIDENTFIYDPHTKEYTGKYPWLKAWIAHSKKIEKGIHSDFIHTKDGSPCFVQIFDNYYDLRERFFICIKSFKKLYPARSLDGKRFTWIVDRGIFGIETLLKINELGDNIITWEKGYKQNGWKANMPYKMTESSKAKNNSKDIVRNYFHYQEYEWEVNSDFRKIIVRAKKHNGNEIEVAIIVTALCCFSAEKIIKLMFNKWIQENDFKFLDKFFGLDQIISYRFLSYDEVAHLFKDRLVEAKIYKKTNKERLIKEKELTQLVRTRYNHDKKIDQKFVKLSDEKRKREMALEKINNQMSFASSEIRLKKLNKELKRLKKLIAKYPDREEKLKKDAQEQRDKIDANIKINESEIKELSETLMTLVKDESRLEHLIAGEYVLPDIAAKNHIDSIKIMARNMFYELLKIFRPMYDNFRDDCAILRELTRLPGVVMKKGNIICIKLWCQADYSKATLEVLENFISTMTSFINGHFQNKASSIEIQLLSSTIKIEDILNP